MRMYYIHSIQYMQIKNVKIYWISLFIWKTSNLIVIHEYLTFVIVISNKKLFFCGKIGSEYQDNKSFFNEIPDDIH